MASPLRMMLAPANVGAIARPSPRESLALGCAPARRGSETPTAAAAAAALRWSGQRAAAASWSGRCACPRAKRKSQPAPDTVQDEEEEQLDEDMRAGLNEVSTEALKAMLSESDRVVAAMREKVEFIEEYLIDQQQHDAVNFMVVVKGMLDHEVVPQKQNLKGAYKKAFDTMASVIEDSGWVLKQEGTDIGGTQMVDDELMPPVLNTQY